MNIDKNLSDIFRNIPGNITKFIGFIFLIWLATGIFIVSPDETGVIKRFGKFTREVPPGPHYHLPFPIESLLKPKVTKIHRIEVGFRTVFPGPPARYESVPQESLMLTGDENIVAVEMIVQYKIKDAKEFLFNVRDPEQTIKAVTESSIREIIGTEHIDEVLTSGKAMIQESTRDSIQKSLDYYKSGIHIIAVQLQDVNPPVEVMGAFKDVASAREDKERLINEALGYQNDIIPKAKGEAAKEINKAEGYKSAVVNRALGDVERFNKTLTEYQKNKEVIGTKIYIEGLEEILSKPEIIIVDGNAAKNLLPILPIDKLPEIKK